MSTSESGQSTEVNNSPSTEVSKSPSIEIMAHLEEIRSGMKSMEEGRAALFTILDDAKAVKPLSEEALAILDKIRADAKVIEEAKVTTQDLFEQTKKIKASSEDMEKRMNEARLYAEENSKRVNELKVQSEVSSNAIANALKTCTLDSDRSTKEANVVLQSKADALALLETIKQHETNSKAIASRAQEQDNKVAEYQNQLRLLTEKCEKLHLQIENLLPGATSANLASAFETRKKTFKMPLFGWISMFVLSIVGFISVGFYILLTAGVPTSWQEWFLRLTSKSPIIIGLVLLEEFSRRQYYITVRLEEDYAYKEVLARSFEGYRKQMKEITTIAESPETKLSNNLLDALKLHPGRYIEKDKTRMPEGLMDGIIPKNPAK